jgi:hypothetical protein
MQAVAAELSGYAGKFRCFGVGVSQSLRSNLLGLMTLRSFAGSDVVLTGKTI